VEQWRAWLRSAVWYEERKRGLGGEFLRAVDHTIAFISRFPEGGTRVPDLSAELPVRRARVQRFPFHVVYLDRMMATGRVTHLQELR